MSSWAGPTGEAQRTVTDDAVRSVDRAAALLLALGDAPGDTGVTELARALSLHKSTASRLLGTLLKSGLVERTDSGRYHLGLTVVRLGWHAEKCIDLRVIAASHLEMLARSVHESTSLETLEGDVALTIAYSDPTGVSRDRYGRSSPLHASAPGKILLANLPEREVTRLSRLSFTPYTANTIVRLDLLLGELARVRKRGFSTAFGEQEPTVNAVAVPVFDQRSAVVAALEVRGPGNRIPPSRVAELVERAREAAAVITDRIGGVPARMSATTNAQPGGTG
jgi:DNA-binding IclR family transcriptional regulator